VNDVEHEEFLNVHNTFMERCDDLWICFGMYRCLKFIAFCYMVVSQMRKSVYILSVHEDDKIIFILGFLYRKLFSVLKLWGFYQVSLKVCLIMYLFWGELEIGGKSKILMVCVWGGFFEIFSVLKIFVPLFFLNYTSKCFSKLHKCLSFRLWSLLFFSIFECISSYYEGLFLFLKYVYFLGLYFWGLSRFF
jgi:hypothetical protein